MNRWLFLWTSALLFFCSCTKEISMDWPLLSEKPVVNAFVVADEPISVFLSRSHSPLSSDSQPINDSEVIIYQNGLSDTMVFNGDGYYSSHCIAKQGSDYALKALIEDTLCVCASDKMPTDVLSYSVTGFTDDVGIDDQGSRYSQFEIIFQDHPKQANYYEVAIEYFDGEDYAFCWCGSNDMSVQSEGLDESAAKYVVFSDKLFDGKEKHLFIRYYPMRYSNDEVFPYDSIVVHFRNVSESYFKYKKTLAFSMAEEDADFWQGMGDPSIMFSNIEGGYGIFACYNEHVDTICRIRW